jgi:hypothetical protein
VIAGEGGDHYRVVQEVETELGARTMALDAKTHAIFLSTAKLGPPLAPTSANPHPPNHPTALPGTFKLLAVSPAVTQNAGNSGMSARDLCAAFGFVLKINHAEDVHREPATCPKEHSICHGDSRKIRLQACFGMEVS